ncbi:hypothetical protein BDF20DRAFT_446923 [Mycotypha africana]|uniref:uncharacterized protein n=1 Tax=Mycotypha africana TaxID=64632 RepID=UPI002301F41A|nr:uncharacterized protein BDF20DRAFT_446923 [Mycotypha africana]KAI8982022.1 hypothetical protein BDF20DRAFT_446923 [Mycotypha africana]
MTSQEPSSSSYTYIQEGSSTFRDQPDFFQRNNLYDHAGALSSTVGEALADLTQAWMNERNAPEILPFERDLVALLLDQVQAQTEKMTELAERNSINTYQSMLYQTEVERVKYVLRSYLRARLDKIERCTLFILRQENLEELLSISELHYAREYQDLMETHNHDSFLHRLPRSQHKQDEQGNGINMVVEPNLDAAVVCKVLKSIGHVNIGGDDILFDVNDVYLLRYRDVREHLTARKLKLV